MNDFTALIAAGWLTGWRGLAIFITLIVTGSLLIYGAITGVIHLANRARQRRLERLIAREETRVTRLVREHTRMTWPDDLCAFPPCWPEDGYVCSWHAPRGQALRYGAAEPLRVHPDGRTRCDGCDDPIHLPDPSDPRWTQ